MYQTTSLFEINPVLKVKKEDDKIIEVRIEFNQYPTHLITYIPKTARGRLKFTKISGNQIYSGKIKEHTRNTLMGKLHNYYKDCMEQLPELKEIIPQILPLNLRMEWYTIPSHEKVKVLKKQLNYPFIDAKKTPPFSPSFDADNQWPFVKAFQDVLVNNGYIPDDTVKYLPSSGCISFIPIPDFTNRRIVFILTPHPDKHKDLWEKVFGYWGNR